jgi:hypothetical protein
MGMIVCVRENTNPETKVHAKAVQFKGRTSPLQMVVNLLAAGEDDIETFNEGKSYSFTAATVKLYAYKFFLSLGPHPVAVC